MKSILNSVILVVSLMVFFSCEMNTKEKMDTIGFDGRQLQINAKDYLIKGICYHPVPKGSGQRSWESLDQDLALMQEAGINTIRVYAPIEEKWVLDKIDAAGMKVVIGFGYNQNGYYDILSGSFIDYINKYKGHNAILFWEFGNEYNYHPNWFDGDMKNWYTAMNDAAIKAKQADPNRPITTAHGDLPDSLALAMSPDIDIWGMNVYRWDDPSDLFGQWATISDKPMYLAEAGGDSYMTVAKPGYEQGLNEKAQADANRNILNSIFNHKDICSGVTLFAFSDEWWKAGNNDVQDLGGWAPNSSGVPYDGSPNEEYWGIVDIDRNKKETFDVVKNIYLKQH
jgi:exo-beta-1,3-glucanase (GH17 family)